MGSKMTAIDCRTCAVRVWRLLVHEGRGETARSVSEQNPRILLDGTLPTMRSLRCRCRRRNRPKCRIQCVVQPNEKGHMYRQELDPHPTPPPHDQQPTLAPCDIHYRPIQPSTIITMTTST